LFHKEVGGGIQAPHYNGPFTVACRKVWMKPTKGKPVDRIGLMISLHCFCMHVVATSRYSSLQGITWHNPKSAAKWETLAAAMEVCQFFHLEKVAHVIFVVSIRCKTYP